MNGAADTIEAIEAVTRAALTAEQQELDGWWLRCNPALPNRRPNSATTPVRGSVDPAVIDATADWYRVRNRAPRIRVLSVSDPAVDRILDERSWLMVAPTRVMTRHDFGGVRSGDATVLTSPDTVPTAFVSLRQELSLTATAAEQALGRRGTASLFGFSPGSGAVVATGRALQDGALVGIFDVVTRPEVRRSGWGSSVVTALLDAASDHGAELAFLQVEERNLPAVGMYEALGFTTLYRYHYREPPA